MIDINDEDLNISIAIPVYCKPLMKLAFHLAH